jgi:formate-dependent nitrite reductase complex subunit NrfG
VERFGDWILFDPPVKTRTILLWLIPGFILIIGFYILYKKTTFSQKRDNLL